MASCFFFFCFFWPKAKDQPFLSVLCHFSPPLLSNHLWTDGFSSFWVDQLHTLWLFFSMIYCNQVLVGVRFILSSFSPQFYNRSVCVSEVSQWTRIQLQAVSLAKKMFFFFFFLTPIMFTLKLVQALVWGEKKSLNLY